MSQQDKINEFLENEDNESGYEPPPPPPPPKKGGKSQPAPKEVRINEPMRKITKIGKIGKIDRLSGTNGTIAKIGNELPDIVRISKVV